MTDNIIKQTEVMRITRDGVWVNPDMAVDETAKALLDALSSQVKMLVQRAVEEEREKVAKWMMDKGYATGHGDIIEDLLEELEWQVAEREREACANICEKMEGLYEGDEMLGVYCADAIRKRGEK